METQETTKRRCARRGLNALAATAREGALFTVHYMRLNRFRTILSLLGVTVGIFTIMAILVAVNSLKESVLKEFSQIDSRSIYIDARPWTFSGSEEEWRRMMRNNRAPDYDDYKALRRLKGSLGKVGMLGVLSGIVVKHNRKAADRVSLCGVLPNHEALIDLTMADGRGFSYRELTGSSNICLLGSNVAKRLFGHRGALAKEVAINGCRLRVVGVLREQGRRTFTRSSDDGVVVPYGFAMKLFGKRKLYNFVAVSPAEGVAQDVVEGELRRIMRGSRRIAPGRSDTFALNRFSSMMAMMDGSIAALNKAAIFLGGFSVLIGAFGIANIMLVSVQERIKIIGIQKALGARSHFILLQFLIEAMLLALLGGVVALIFLWLLSQVVALVGSFEVAMRWWHVALGCGISVAVGLVAGLIPARRAARLQPVVAIEGLASAR